MFRPLPGSLPQAGNADIRLQQEGARRTRQNVVWHATHKPPCLARAAAYRMEQFMHDDAPADIRGSVREKNSRTDDDLIVITAASVRPAKRQESGHTSHAPVPFFPRPRYGMSDHAPIRAWALVSEKRESRRPYSRHSDTGRKTSKALLVLHLLKEKCGCIVCATGPPLHDGRMEARHFSGNGANRGFGYTEDVNR